MFDVTRLVPEARPIAQKAATVYVHHAGDDFVGLIAHGSAVKGGFIVGCSDIDFQLYVHPRALDLAGHLPFELTVSIHSDLSRIEPSPFRYIQCYAFSSEHRRAGWVGPVPGTYALIAGRLPTAEATAVELRTSAARAIAELPPSGVPPYLADTLLDHGGGRLAQRVRLLCTDVWPALYQLLITHGGDPIAVWIMTKQQAIDSLPVDGDAAEAIRAFYAAVLSYYPSESSALAGLEVMVHGVAFLRAAAGENASR